MTRISAIVQDSVLPLVTAAFVAGLIVGLVVLGWWLWPVEWKDASPADLQSSWQDTYLTMVADSYALNGDAGLARERIAALQTPSRTTADIGLKLQAMAKRRLTVNDSDGAGRLDALATAIGVAPAGAASGSEAGTLPGPPRAESSPITRLMRVCGLVILVLVILAGLLLLVYFLQSRTAAEPATEVRMSAATASAHSGAAPVASQAAVETYTPPPVAEVAPQRDDMPETAAIGPFVATYNLGDIDFDMSFGIESPSGDFLGECGLGMAETIGGGEVQRVTAFEVWLFDKTDIRTISLVLASEHANSDAALRTKLASRGDVILAEPGGEFSVSTSTLELQGRVLDLAYGGGDVPAQSYFTSLSVELVPVLLGSGQAE
jgi:hypothetical protein